MTATGPALDLVALARELVRRPTVSGDADAQRDVLGTLTEVLRERAPDLQVTEGRDRDHPWTLLRTPADPDRRCLLLACHVDTVPATDPSAWQRDPFDGDLDGGRVWGRGGSDMKAGVVAAAAALAAADPGTPVSDRKSTRLNSSHANISYAVFCFTKKSLKKKTPMLFAPIP